MTSREVNGARSVAIAIDHSEERAERTLAIRGADGSTTKVEFRSPMGPGRGDTKAVG